MKIKRVNYREEEYVGVPWLAVQTQPCAIQDFIRDLIERMESKLNAPITETVR